MHVIRRGPSTVNPHFCSVCENYARKHRGGAEVEFTMLFADIRGSTPLAEGLGTAAFSQLIDRFYRTATDVLVAEDGLINRLLGDEAVAFFLPGWVGAGHAQGAVRAARNLLEATGHTDPAGPWAPVGIGVNTGTAPVTSSISPPWATR
jgi:adenylate cyclase